MTINGGVFGGIKIHRADISPLKAGGAGWLLVGGELPVVVITSAGGASIRFGFVDHCNALMVCAFMI